MWVTDCSALRCCCKTEPIIRGRRSENCISATIWPSVMHLQQHAQIILCRPTSVSAESSCSVSSLVYESLMFLMLRKPCRPQGRLTVTSKSVTSFTEPSISIPSFTFWTIHKKQTKSWNCAKYLDYTSKISAHLLHPCHLITHSWSGPLITLFSSAQQCY